VGIWDRDYMKSPFWRRRQEAWEAGATSGKGGVTITAPSEGRVAPVVIAPPAQRRRKPIRLALVAALIAAGLVGGYAVGVTDDQERLNPMAPDPLVVWAGESFYSQREFVGWLAQHGFDHERWLKRHPAIKQRLEAASS
jgi:hypothetical protein